MYKILFNVCEFIEGFVEICPLVQNFYIIWDLIVRLCGLVVRVPSYRY
jgi:hypothetical protein